MPLNRSNTTIILGYTIIGLGFTAILFSIVSLSTTHWIHTKFMRAGFWKLCHLQPTTCFYSIVHSPAALSLTGLLLIVIGLLTTFVFNIIDWQMPVAMRRISLISVISLGLGTFFFVISYAEFSRIVGPFCYSYYLLIMGQVFSTTAAIVASYLEGQRNALVSTSAIMSRLVVRRP